MIDEQKSSAKGQSPLPHPLRDIVAGELHSRPPASLAPPCVLLRVVLVTDEMTAGADRDYVAGLCQRFNVGAPEKNSRWFAGRLGDVHLRWERHTEMSTLTLFWDVPSETPLFESRVPVGWPANWLEGAPGYLLGATHMEIREAKMPTREVISDLFENQIALATPDKKRFLAATDFRLDADGFSRIMVWSDGVEPGELGRRVQRLLEIETYRLAALLSFPVATGVRGDFGKIEADVNQVMETLIDDNAESSDSILLNRLSNLSAKAEALSARTSYRYAAGRAYHRLVWERLEKLTPRPDDGKIMDGLPSYATYLQRRLEPAMRTCDATEERQKALIDRIARATTLLATRVEVHVGEQNAELLASMNTRARQQLQLQETVEGLSVFAISYYAVGLISYLAKAGYDLGLPFKASFITGLAVPVVVTILWLGLRRFHKNLAKHDADNKH